MPAMAETGAREVCRIDDLDDVDLGALIAIAGLPNLTPGRFWSLLALDRPAPIWKRIRSGGAPLTGRARDAAIGWPAAVRDVDPAAELERHRSVGVAVLPFGHSHYPGELIEDPDPPVVLFRRGPASFDNPLRVAIVGTRRCTRYGRDISRALGAALARRGVDVVSGLAHGIDAAAHAGASLQHADRIIAVVAGGVDVVYPRNNAELFESVGRSGMLLSEWPLGARPVKWRFPARNRLVAALSSVVVVVESGESGGSMYTVEEALQRDRVVYAVPGSINSPASAGTNRLLADGAHVLTSVDEFVDSVQPLSRTAPAVAAALAQSWLLDLLGWEPVALETVVVESGRSPSEVTLEVERLIADGRVRRLGAVVERTP